MAENQPADGQFVFEVSADESAHLDAHSKLQINFNGRKMVISLLLTEDDIAPLFDGAAWAGTQLWDAAVVAISYVHRVYREQMSKGLRVIELGCGTGVPGMCCRIMGAQVLLTEQPELIPLISQNVEDNFSGDSGIRAEVLSWDRERSAEILRKNGAFDLVLVCDCVFPPVYGDSWRPLADSVHVLLQGLDGDTSNEAGAGTLSASRVAVFSVERRNGDKMDEFLSYVDSLVPKIECREVLNENKITIYEMRLQT